jgi:hypothetical protein
MLLLFVLQYAFGALGAACAKKDVEQCKVCAHCTVCCTCDCWYLALTSNCPVLQLLMAHGAVPNDFLKVQRQPAADVQPVVDHVTLFGYPAPFAEQSCTLVLAVTAAASHQG